VLADKYVGGEFLNGSIDSSETTKSFSLSRLKTFLQCFGIALQKFGKVVNKLSNYDEGFEY